MTALEDGRAVAGIASCRAALPPQTQFSWDGPDMMQTQRDVEPHDSPADGLEAIVDFEPHVVFAAAPLGHLPVRLGGRFALHLVRVGVRERPRGAVPHTPHLIEAPHGVRL